MTAVATVPVTRIRTFTIPRTWQTAAGLGTDSRLLRRRLASVSLTPDNQITWLSPALKLRSSNVHFDLASSETVTLGLPQDDDAFIYAYTLIGQNLGVTA